MTIENLKEKGLIIYEVLSGSQLYGTNTPESDVDMKGIFVLPLDMILSNQYIEQISDEKNDIVYYELGRFIHLLKSSNPNMLETLFAPEDKIIYKHPIMGQIFELRDKFITKECNGSLVGYSRSQISKSKGLNKMQNWESEDMKRKSVLDFCYSPYEQGSTHIEKFLEKKGLKQEYCGLVAVPNMRYTYNVFYDFIQHIQREKLSYVEALLLFESGHIIYEGRYRPYTNALHDEIIENDRNYKYKGIVQKETSNDISLSSIPKGEKSICILTFNKDGYTQHCKKYKSYETWLAERNTARYVDRKEHGQAYDGKNLMHCVRLLRMGKEIAEGKGYIVKRPDAEYLLTIRKGKVELEDIIYEAEKGIQEIDELFSKSNLPETIDVEFCNNLLLKLRKEMYGLS